MTNICQNVNAVFCMDTHTLINIDNCTALYGHELKAASSNSETIQTEGSLLFNFPVPNAGLPMGPVLHSAVVQ